MGVLRYKNVLLDVDGTLYDPGDGITSCVARALADMGREPLPGETLRRFVGPPLIDSFMMYAGMDEEQAREARNFYRKHFSEYGLLQAKPYAGIRALLDELMQRHARLFIASSKPRVFIDQMLQLHGLTDYFEDISADHFDAHSMDKAQIIGHLLRSHALSGQDSVMVGDRKFDIEGARANGIDCIGVAYGYGTVQELKEYGANYIAMDVEALRALLLRD
ncbi:MAG: HAD hydrolase-like protein [Christensenellales bacterium]|jgi:phosphoglycolate phosphatase